MATDPDYEASALLKTLCDGNRLHLIESKRSGDGPFCSLYSSLAIGGKRQHWPLERQVAFAKRCFPKAHDTKFHLVTSNAQRVALNTRLNRDFYGRRGGEGRWLAKRDKKAANESQGFWLHKGLLMIAYMSQGVKAGFHNGQLVEVLAFDTESVQVRNIERPMEATMSLQFLRDNWRLGYAFTGYSAQGRSLGNEASATEPERGLTVWTEHPKVCARALFTGISRCRSGRLLQVA